MLPYKNLVINLSFACCLFFSAGTFADTSNVVIKFYPDSQTDVRTNPVNLVFTGNLYKDRPLLEQGKPESLKLSAAETALAKFLEVNAKGTAQQVLEVWNPPERESIKGMLSQPDLFARNKAFNSNISEIRLVAKINYGTFTLFFIQYKWLASDYKVQSYPFIEKDGQYFATNLLASDFFYSRVSPSLEQYFEKSRTQK